MILIRIHNKHYEIYKHDSIAIRFDVILIPPACMCCCYMLRVCGCVFCLFACLRSRISSNPRSTAGVRSIRPGASRLSYYCAPLVCVPTVLGLLAVWRHKKLKTKTANCEVFGQKQNKRQGAFLDDNN